MEKNKKIRYGGFDNVVTNLMPKSAYIQVGGGNEPHMLKKQNNCELHSLFLITNVFLTNTDSDNSIAIKIGEALCSHLVI